MTELYQIDLYAYRDYQDSTRLIISEVEPTAAAFPIEIHTDIKTLVSNVSNHQPEEGFVIRARRAISQSLRETQHRGRGYPFVATAKLRGTHFSLVINGLEEDSLRPGAITVQTTNLFDLVKGHSSNLGFLDHLQANWAELIKVAKDFLARFQSLHQSAAEACKHVPIVLSGVSNLRRFYAMCEVRPQGFLIHSLKINNEWQSVSDYYHITINRPANIYTVANIYHAPWTFLHLEDGGQSFTEQARRQIVELEKKYCLYNATCGMVFTPAPPSGLPTDERFWFKLPAQKAPISKTSDLSRAQMEIREQEARRHEMLRSEAQAFAEQFCSDGRLQRAWDAAVRQTHHVTSRTTIAPFMVEVHRLEGEELNNDEWNGIDWTKAFPRIDGIAKTWALSKIRTLGIETGPTSDFMDGETALENTKDLREAESLD